MDTELLGKVWPLFLPQPMEIATALSCHGHGFLEGTGREGPQVFILFSFFMFFFQPFPHPKVFSRIPSGATLTLPFRVRPTQEELHGIKTPLWVWELAIKLIGKLCLLFDINYLTKLTQLTMISHHFTTFPSKRAQSSSVLRLQTTLTFSIDGVDSPSSELTESEAQWFPCKYV